MANNGKYVRGRMSTPALQHGAAIVHAGYTDFAAGLGYRAQYDAWPRHDQIRYELGRHYAAVAKAALGEVPPWPRNRLLRLRGVAGTLSEHRFMAVPVAA